MATLIAAFLCFIGRHDTKPDPFSAKYDSCTRCHKRWRVA